MTVRLRLALTVLLTGLGTALGVVVAVGLAFERFEREATFARADAFLGRVVANHADLLEQQQRAPEPFTEFLRSLLLLEPDTQLYLLAADGTVLSRSGRVPLPAGFKVAIEPVRSAAAAAAAGSSRALAQAAYVMGDDPEYMDDHAVIAARALRRASVHPDATVAGYLYLVCRKPGLPPSRLARFAGNLAGPALGPVLAVVLLATLLAAWIIATVTRPLARLSRQVASAAQRGFEAGAGPAAAAEPAARGNDEFAHLQRGFQMLMARLRQQWDQLRRLDAFRRESVSNLSHDLRSPLTAAAAALETLQQRWARSGEAAPEARQLLDVALRNTHNAARLVRALGDLAVLDEAEFRLRLARLDLGEVLDDIVMRFAARAAASGVALRHETAAEGAGAEPLAAEVDIELFERAVANLLDNALRHTPAGGEIVLHATLSPAADPDHDHHHDPGRDPGRAGMIAISVRDNGSGIAEEDQSQIFERHVQGRAGTARGDGNKGLGLAIVQRIAELHGGRVVLTSRPGQGTCVTLLLPRRSGPPAGATGPAPTT